ncbi:hypothetical protein DXV75_05115 [Alteromonas aestuariivivens]|uniref:ATP-grasp domain-containing protein n=1 Tax=Alteromonas aestuariivivens TaxID=1938339 RepID=A0A3D8MAV4_9ALTE|nr:hypothetical protein [Alteromonas aestuariivivens]RDV27412.1 hypothetical protein DXV75_05115 [Alteromonas aestuariivivens]
MLDGTKKNCLHAISYPSSPVNEQTSLPVIPQPEENRTFFDKLRDAVIRQSHSIPLEVADFLVQWSWFLFGIDPKKVGYGKGPITWYRKRTMPPKRQIRIHLLGAGDTIPRFAELTAWAINRGSSLCSATVRGDLSEADVIWIYDQDPIHPDLLDKLKRKISPFVRCGAAVINEPGTYNAYHKASAFPRLERAGVSVPRFRFTQQDIGKCLVVYKSIGKQGKRKWLDYFDGERPGCKAFEYIHCLNNDGLFRRYRAHYLAGMVRGSEVMLSDSWHVCNRRAVGIEYDFVPTDYEKEQITRIAKVLSLDYFAVDYLRPPKTGGAVFTDINVFPTVQSPRSRVHARGDWGLWHTFDARARLGIKEPDGGPVWLEFDRAMEALVENAHSQSNVKQRKAR